MGIEHRSSEEWLLVIGHRSSVKRWICNHILQWNIPDGGGLLPKIPLTENREPTTDNHKVGQILWILPLFVSLLCCASVSKEEPISWEITFFSLGAKVQFGTTAPIQRLSAFNPDDVMIAQLSFPVPPRQTESLYFQWSEAETYRFEATLTTGDIIVQSVTAPLTYTQGNFRDCDSLWCRN